MWLEGERVEDVTTHPKLARMAKTLAGVYDLQHDPDTRDLMAFGSPRHRRSHIALLYDSPLG